MGSVGAVPEASPPPLPPPGSWPHSVFVDFEHLLFVTAVRGSESGFQTFSGDMTLKEVIKVKRGVFTNQEAHPSHSAQFFLGFCYVGMSD